MAVVVVVAAVVAPSSPGQVAVVVRAAVACVAALVLEAATVTTSRSALRVDGALSRRRLLACPTTVGCVASASRLRCGRTTTRRCACVK